MKNTLDLQVDENSILNLTQVMQAINAMEYNLNAKEYLEALEMHLSYKEYSNKRELLDLIHKKLLEFSNEELRKMNNRETLEAMQQYNDDLKKIVVLETKKEENDSKKDIDYITIRHDDGSIEMLVCEGANTINQYVQMHLNKVSKNSAEDIFHHFKEYIHKNLVFYNEYDFEKSQYKNSAIFQDKELLAQEREELKEYAFRIGINDSIKIAIDSYGERIYMVGDAIVKFHFNNENKRVMQVLLNPTLHQTNQLPEEFNDLEDDYDKTQIFDFENLQIAMGASYEPKEKDKEGFSFHADKFNMLVEKSKNEEDALSIDEKDFMLQSAQYLLNLMAASSEINEIDDPELICLDGYIEFLQQKEEYQLTEKDKRYIDVYMHMKEQRKKQNKDNESLTLSLELPKSRSGVATVLLLVGIGIIGMLFLGILSLVMP